jgi:tryptophan-rich sensory protein
MNDLTEEKEAKQSSREVKTLLFFANWLFLVFLSKRFFSSPERELDFLLKNTGAFLLALIMTGVMAHFFSRKAMILFIPVMVFLSVAAALG